MLLTIVIPSYQQGYEIEQALNSIRKQTFSDLEVLIIDGGSTDDTALIVAKFNDLNIRFFQEKDSGVYDAMNKGVLLSNGQFIYFMGCDDRLYDNNVLNKVSEFLKREEVDFLYGDVVLKKEQIRYAGEFTVEKLLFVENICHQSIFYRKTIFDKIGLYNLKYKIWADWDFNIRCFKNTSFCVKYIDCVIALYNNNSGLSSNYDPVFFKELPLYYVPKLKLLEQTNKNLLKSKSFIIGNAIVKIYNKTLNSLKGRF